MRALLLLELEIYLGSVFKLISAHLIIIQFGFHLVAVHERKSHLVALLLQRVSNASSNFACTVIQC